MHSSARELMTRSWPSQANLSLFLFLSIMVGFVLPSVGFERNNLQLYGVCAFSLMSLFGAALAWDNRILLASTLLVSMVSIVLRWMAWWTPTRTLTLWSVSTGLAAIAAITVVLLWQVFRPGPVTRMRVEGAIAAYLCLGVCWAHAYHITALLDSAAFDVTRGNVALPTTWVNYSFGVLTTIGYAGIVPAKPYAHSLGSSEAVTGQLYLAVLVARLVAKQVSAADGDHP